MPPAPLPRAAAGAAVIGHRLYVAGGRSDTLTTISTLAIFDFDTGKWSLGPSLHHAREHVAGVAAGGAVWILGGRAVGLGNFADVERYRPGASAWDRLPAMPVARSGFQAVNVEGKIVVVGGEGPAGTIAEVDELNPATGHWTQAARPSDCAAWPRIGRRRAARVRDRGRPAAGPDHLSSGREIARRLSAVRRIPVHHATAAQCESSQKREPPESGYLENHAPIRPGLPQAQTRAPAPGHQGCLRRRTASW